MYYYSTWTWTVYYSNHPYPRVIAEIFSITSGRAQSQAILVIPRTYSWLMGPIYESNKWRRVQYWHKNAKLLFKRHARDSILGSSARPCRPSWCSCWSRVIRN